MACITFYRQHVFGLRVLGLFGKGKLKLLVSEETQVILTPDTLNFCLHRKEERKETEQSR